MKILFVVTRIVSYMYRICSYSYCIVLQLKNITCGVTRIASYFNKNISFFNCSRSIRPSLEKSNVVSLDFPSILLCNFRLFVRVILWPCVIRFEHRLYLNMRSDVGLDRNSIG